MIAASASDLEALPYQLLHDPATHNIHTTQEVLQPACERLPLTETDRTRSTSSHGLFLRVQTNLDWPKYDRAQETDDGAQIQ